MRHHLLRLAIILGILGLAGLAGAGVWSANEFFYKPSLGARGEAEKNTFDSGLDRVDARLAKEVWLGDPKLGTSLAQALTTLGSTPTFLRVPPGTYTVDSNLTVPTHINLILSPGALFQVSNGCTLTIQGKLQAEPYQIFAWSGTGSIDLNGDKEAWIEWWGAKGDDAMDCTTIINKAIASNPGKLKFSAGTYRVSGVLNATLPIQISGAGKGKTIIKSTVSPLNHHGFFVYKDFLLENLTLRANETAQSTYYFGVKLDFAVVPPVAGTNLRVRNCEILGFDNGVGGQGHKDGVLYVDTFEVDNCRIIVNSLSTHSAGSHTTAGFQGCKQLKITNSYLQTARSNYIDNNIYCPAWVENAEISNNYIKWGFAVRFMPALQHLFSAYIRNNIFDGTWMSAVHQTSESGNYEAKLVIWEHNRFINNHGNTNYGLINVEGNVLLHIVRNNIFEATPEAVFTYQIPQGRYIKSAIHSGNTYYNWSTSSPGTYRVIHALGSGSYGALVGTDEYCDGNNNGATWYRVDWDLFTKAYGSNIHEVNVTSPVFAKYITMADYLSVGGGEPIKGLRSGSKNWDPPLIPNETLLTTTVNVPGAQPGDAVTVGFSRAMPGGVILTGHVTAPDTVTVVIYNKSGSAFDLQTGILKANAWRH